MNETNNRIREEYITAYDMRGSWASEEAKQNIREQINDKIAELLKSQKESLVEIVKNLLKSYHLDQNIPANGEGKQILNIGQFMILLEDFLIKDEEK